MELEKANALMMIWKNAEQLEYAVKLVRAGYELARKGFYEFATDDIPEAEQTYGSHLPGLVTKQLASAGLIVRLKVHSEDHGSQAVQRKSKRPSRGGAMIPVYYLRSLGLAEAFLDLHKVSYQRGQAEMAF